jgi:CubicO group peptidase (beta-lactamase class C family)
VPGWPAATVSHTGFTGTAVAFDPDGGTFALVLSNAVADGSGASLRWLRSMFASLAPSVNPSGRDGTV